MEVLVKGFGLDSLSASEVSRICKILDEKVEEFLKKPIETPMSPGRGLTRDGWKTTYCYSVTLSLIWAVKADKFMGRLIP